MSPKKEKKNACVIPEKKATCGCGQEITKTYQKRSLTTKHGGSSNFGFSVRWGQSLTHIHGDLERDETCLLAGLACGNGRDVQDDRRGREASIWGERKKKKTHEYQPKSNSLVLSRAKRLEKDRMRFN